MFKKGIFFRKEKMTTKFLKENADYFYFAFRVLVGLMFIQHGAQKLFGAFGGVTGEGSTVQLFSLFGLAGVIEFFGGLLFGFLTRWAALFGIFDMLGAWIKVHIKIGWIPILNQGELVVLFFASFLIILVYGAKKWGLDNLLFRSKK